MIARTLQRVGLIRIELDVSSLQAGSTQVARGFNFSAGESVSGLLESEPVDLGTQVADDQGSVTFTFTVPADTPVGTDTVTLAGVESGAVQATFTVVAPEPVPGPIYRSLPLTGAFVGMILLVAAGFIAMGIGFVRGRRMWQVTA